MSNANRIAADIRVVICCLDRREIINSSLTQEKGKDSVSEDPICARLPRGDRSRRFIVSKTAIVFHSLHGNVRSVALKLAEQTGADIFEITIPGADKLKGFWMYFRLGFLASAKRCPKIEGGDVDLTGYDTIIIGSLVWAGTFSPALRTFFRNRPVTAGKVGAFFSHKGGLKHAPKDLDLYLGLDGRLISADEIEPDRHGRVDELAAKLLKAMDLESK